MWQAKTGKPIWEGLGGTEMMHLVTSNTMSDVPMPDSIGRALPGFEIKVVREDGTTAGPGEVGSMMIKGPTATLYWKPYIQDNKLLKTMKKGIKDGYNMMGDAVMMDKDGFIFFQAREDDMIKSSGFRLAPSEIEDAIIRHKAVRDDAVVGIPDEIMGQKVVAMVELEPGQHRLPGTGQRHHQVLPGRAWPSTSCPGKWSSWIPSPGRPPARSSRRSCGSTTRTYPNKYRAQGKIGQSFSGGGSPPPETLRRDMPRSGTLFLLTLPSRLFKY